MINAIIRASIAQRGLVLLLAVVLAIAGLWATKTTPVDALPDLSDVQVIVRTSFAGQAPQVIEQQITYPISTAMLSVPQAKSVRGYSFFGDSYVYVLFDEGTDLYWARSRVLEYLNQVQAQLPEQANLQLGPDATGVGWVYEYALVDRTGQHSLADLTSLQNWFLRFELQTLPNVAEVATIGGMVKQYQVILDPERLRYYQLNPQQVTAAIQAANQEVGGAVIELAEAEYMVRATGYLSQLSDFKKIVLSSSTNGAPILLSDVAYIQLGPQLRRGIAELNGEGEVVGGVVVVRAGGDVRSTLTAVQNKIESLRPQLPDGVELVVTYDRSQLIDRAVGDLQTKLIEEILIVSLVCALFLWHLRSAGVIAVALPLGVLGAFLVLRMHGLNANILSLGGIAIAIGAMVDAAVVMVENAHKHLERWQQQHPDQVIPPAQRWQLVSTASQEVGGALFASLLLITVSFVPIFALDGAAGKLFHPLAYTKTYAMAVAAALSITLVPVLMGYWIRGKIPDEQRNPITRRLKSGYTVVLQAVLDFPKTTIWVTLLLLVSMLYPMSRLGSEFMPPLDEGDLLYMPTALPGLSANKAAELLQLTDRMIKSVPEVDTVFGKAGRAESATDPAPLTMFETTIQFKPRSEWREGMTPETLRQALDEAVQVPGLTNFWVPPIRNRLDMLSTGIKTPIGIRVSGSDLQQLADVATQIEQLAKDTEGVSSALAERLIGGRYVVVDIDRARAAQYGLSIADIQRVVGQLMGGQRIGEVIDGIARYPIQVRYPRDRRDSMDDLQRFPMWGVQGQQLVLADVADIRIEDGAPMLKSENGRLSTWVYIDVRDAKAADVAQRLERQIAQQITLPTGVSVGLTGQYQQLERTNQRLMLIIPATVLLIALLLYAVFRRWLEVGVILLTLPFALIGSVWLLYVLDIQWSVAVAVGGLALLGIAAEFGIIMLLYLRQAVQDALQQQADGAFTPARLTPEQVDRALMHGAVQRVRPKAMTVATILAGLLPIALSSATGAEVMSRIAWPMLGGMISAPLLSLLVLPVMYRYALRWQWRHHS